MDQATRIKRWAKIHLGKQSFWEFCKALAPDFYREDRPHLKTICHTLQALYEDRIVKYSEAEPWQILPIGEKAKEGAIICKKLMLNVPPQHGKSRTLVLFCMWMFGKNPNEKVITGSYNDSTASDFSKYTRDGIDARSLMAEEIVFSHIFPETKIKKGTSSYEKWAIEGNHFSYLGAGVGGSITSKGAGVLIVDDPIKGAEEALNETALDKIWLWYTSTFSSRVSAEKGEPIEIICMTRWSKGDLCGRILDDKKLTADWYQIKMAAFDEVNKKMLCEQIFGRKRYESIQRTMLPSIFGANYKQEAIEEKGRLFKKETLNRFKSADLREEKGDAVTLAYIDVADQGDDDLAMVLGRCYQNKIFITDIIFTKDTSDITLPRCAALIDDCGIEYTRVEANNQGHIFMQELAELCGGEILPVKNTTNKHTRIMLEYARITRYFYFLAEDEIEEGSEYDRALNQLCAYMKEKKLNKGKHDDAADAMSGLSKFIKGFVPHLVNLKHSETDEEETDGEENEEREVD